MGSPSDDHFVFAKGGTSAIRRHPTGNEFRESLEAVRREAKVSARVHDLRHTRIPKLAETGAGDETIVGIAGHVSRQMLSRYAHIRTEAKRQALESIVRPVEVIPPVQAG